MFVGIAMQAYVSADGPIWITRVAESDLYVIATDMGKRLMH